MQERVNQLLGSQASNITLGTFHNFGARVLRQYGDILGIDKQFVIYDDDEQKSIVKQSLEEFSLDLKLGKRNCHYWLELQGEWVLVKLWLQLFFLSLVLIFLTRT